MALTKVITEDKIEVVGDHKAVQVRTKTSVMEDGVELSSGFHRHSLACSTKSVKTAYQTAMDAAEI
jgi:hypothetical protein